MKRLVLDEVHPSWKSEFREWLGIGGDSDSSGSDSDCDEPATLTQMPARLSMGCVEPGEGKGSHHEDVVGAFDKQADALGMSSNPPTSAEAVFPYNTNPSCPLWSATDVTHPRPDEWVQRKPLDRQSRCNHCVYAVLVTLCYVLC